MKKNIKYTEDRSNKVNESMGDLSLKTYHLSSVVLFMSVVVLWLIIFQFKYTYVIITKLQIYKKSPIIENSLGHHFVLSRNDVGLNCVENDIKTELYCLATFDSEDAVNIIQNQNVHISISNNSVIVGRMLSIQKVILNDQISYLIKIRICQDSVDRIKINRNKLFPLNGTAKIKCSKRYYILDFLK